VVTKEEPVIKEEEATVNSRLGKISSLESVREDFVTKHVKQIREEN
jgi:hypothetical protein